MQRIFNLSKWTRLAEKGGLHFSNPRPRNVRVEVNAPVKTALHVVDGDGEAHFLALVEGRDTVEFGSSGAFTLTVEGAAVMVYTADGDDIAHREIAPVTFTKIVERRRRSPELEHMQWVMQRNMEKRLNEQTAELERRLAALSAAQAHGSGDPGKPASPDQRKPSSPRKEKADGTTGESGSGAAGAAQPSGGVAGDQEPDVPAD